MERRGELDSLTGRLVYSALIVAVVAALLVPLTRWGSRLAAEQAALLGDGQRAIAVVTERDTYTVANGGGQRVYSIAFSFEHEGQTYTGNQIVSRDLFEAAGAGTIPVTYLEDDPSVVEIVVWGPAFTIGPRLFSALIAALGLFGLWHIWHRPRPRGHT